MQRPKMLQNKQEKFSTFISGDLERASPAYKRLSSLHDVYAQKLEASKYEEIDGKAFVH